MPSLRLARVHLRGALSPGRFKRWADVDGRRVQRDLYSAFLLMCASADADRADKARCDAAWPRFLEDHKAAIAALKGKEGLPSSMDLRSLAGR